MKTEVNIKLSTDEIVVMCEKLARRYRRPHMNDDLVSEGVLAVYERLESTPDDYPASLYRRANKAMYDYINVKTKAITIPTSRAATEVALGNEYTGQNYSEKGKKALGVAINSVAVSFDETYMTSIQDCTEVYEQQEYIKKAMRKLSDREEEVILMRYFQDMTQNEISLSKGVSQQSVAVWEETALLKMSKV
jgi:RNA polymerase sigma factor (sigma-70 family)|tara:strand:+ start:693 stop:1268 length:576 start_codon:yes stop_codon:yes gene_type:complete